MNLTSVKTIKNLCAQYGIRPSKKMGQNFLINKNVLDKIVAAGELDKNDTVLEIGPGFGVLTVELLKRVKKVVAVEKDKRLCQHLSELRTQTTEHKNGLEIINDDVLNLPPLILPLQKGERYKIVSNLPYQITSPVLWKFLNEVKNKPLSMVLMVQKEVGERIVATPRRCANDCGKPGKMSVLSVMCQFYSDCEIVSLVSRNNFYPPPVVDSAIVKLNTRMNMRMSSNKYANIVNEKEFIRLIKIGFSSKRKMLKNNLATGFKISSNEAINILTKAGLNAKIRAQELGVNDWIKILNII